MLAIIGEELLDAVLDTLKIAPFLYLTYLLMEALEHKAGQRLERAISRSGAWGPLFGSLFGMIPQCGFAGAAANFYAARVITLGTLFSIFLATSDEMLPILISAAVAPAVIVRILAVKFAGGLLFGFLVDLVYRLNGRPQVGQIRSLCQQENCGCEHSGIFKAALIHTAHILLFLFLVTLGLNLAIAFTGLENIGETVFAAPVVGELLAGLVGLIPNCSASVIITGLYLHGVMSSGPMMASLFINAGVGLLVLWRMNKSWRENLLITAVLYGAGVLFGCLIELVGIVF